MALVDFKTFPSFAQSGAISGAEEGLDLEALDGTPDFDVFVPPEAAGANNASMLAGNGESFWTNHVDGANFPYPDRDEWIVGAWMRQQGTAETTPTTRSDILLRLYDGANVQLSITANAQAGGLITLDLRRGATDGTIVSTSPAGILDDDQTWSFYEFKIKISNTVGSIICMKDGVEVWNDNGFDNQEQTASTANRVLLAGLGSSGGWVIYNSIYILDTTGSKNNDFLGPVVAIASKTTADTAQADWSPISGADGFLMLDEYQVSSGSNSVTSTTLGDESTFEMDNHAAAFDDFNVIAIKSFLHAGDIVTTSTIKLKMEVSAGTHDFGAETFDSTFLPSFTYSLEDNPITASAWTMSEYNSIELSIERIT